MSNYQEEIAKILRCSPDVIYDLERQMDICAAKKGVLEGLLKENNQKIEDRIKRLGVKNQIAEEVFTALINKIAKADKIFVQRLGNISLTKVADCQRVLDFLYTHLPPLKGFFIKKEKAKELLIKEPPQKILSYLGYNDVKAMIEKEDLDEIFAGLRFVEDNKWLNEVFFKQYEDLKPEDFENREVKLKALSIKWKGAAEKFVIKKYHNISHLKEFGVVFVIPVVLNIPGEVLRMISLILHYYYEVKFYSDIFRRYSKDDDFARKLITILKGDLGGQLDRNSKCQWLIIQQYLAKDNENDPRLFVPHVNPEAVHWYKAENDMAKFGQWLEGIEEDFSFWEGISWVGKYFLNQEGKEELISFDLVDNTMSLVKEKERIKYLYHQQEALWNEIFARYFSHEELEQKIKENLIKGVINL